MPAEPDDKEWITTGQAAKILGVSVNTMRKYADILPLTYHRLPGVNGDRRFRADEIENLLSPKR